MRKYLWALALCGAAGMAIPGWAQERTRSLFGLGRSKSTTTAPTQDTKAAKPSKLKNYNAELFGDEDSPAPTSAAAATAAPAPKDVAVTKESAPRAEETRKSSSLKDVLAEKPAPKSPSKTAGKAPVEPLDQEEAVALAAEEAEEAAEEAAEAAEEKALAEKAAAKVAARDVSSERTSGRVTIQTPPKRPAAVKPKSSISEEESSEKPAWAMESTSEIASEFEPVEEPAKEKVAAADESAEEAPAVVRSTARQSAAKSVPAADADEAAVVVKAPAKAPAAKPPVAKEEVVTKVPAAATRSSVTKSVAPKTPATKATAAKPVPSTRSVVKSTATRLSTPISVASVDDESPDQQAITPASAAETVPEADPAKPAAPRGSVSIARSTGIRPTRTSESIKTADASDAASNVYASKSGPATAQSPTVTVEWRASGAINVGQESSCDLIVKNSGSVTAKKVEVEAAFPANVRLVSSEPKPSTESDLVWQFDEIAPGDEKIVKVKFIPVERGEVAASANVRFTGAASTSFAVTEPLLGLKIEGANEVMVGEVTSQVLIISNPGTGTAANVKVEAILPPGLVHAKGERLAMELGNLAAGESRPVRLSLTAESGGRQIIEVHATADSGLLQSASSEVSVIAPSLKSSIEGPGLRYLGRQATYKLHVENDGPVATDNVSVMHKIPDGFDFVSAEKGAQYSEQDRMLRWFVGHLDRGEKADVNVVMTAKTAGEYTHYIRATSDHGAVSDSETATRVEGAASLVVDVVDLDDPVEVGVETAYEVRVKNEGTAAASNVSLTCELPAGVEFMTASGPASFVNEKELVVFKAIDELAPGKSLTFQVKVKGTVTGNMRFRTKLSSDSIAEPLASEELTKVYGE